MIVTFLNSYLIPFLMTLIGLGLNEYRLFRIGKLEYYAFTNSLAMLIISLLTFMTMQVMMTKLL